VTRFAGRLLDRLQSRRAFRRVARRVVTFETRVATAEEHRRFALQRRPDQRVGPLVASQTEIVAVARGRLVGHVILSRQPESHPRWPGVWAMDMWVFPHWRGSGAGEALFAAALGVAARDGARELFVAVDATNRRSLTLHRKLGAEEVAVEWPTLPADGRTRLVLRRAIDPGREAPGGPAARPGPVAG
jgi:L-amino acid N-acyltransferase YncA